MKKLKIFSIELSIFLLIFVLAIFLRFYNLKGVANFDFDQEYAANFAYAVVKEFPIQLIGQGLSIQGLFIGPLYFYYLVPFFMLTNLHPIGGIIGSAVFGLITIFAYFFVTKSVFGTKAALIITFLRSVLFTELGNDWAMAPALQADLPALLTWYFFYKYWEGHVKIFPWVGFIFGVYTSLHPILFPFYLVFLFLILLKKRLPNVKMTIVSFVAFLIPVSPLLVFEYFHNFLEVRRIVELFTGPTLESKGLSQISSYIRFNLSDPQRILGLEKIPLITFSILLFVAISLLVKKRVSFWKQKFHIVILGATYTLFIGYYSLFPAHVPEYYFMALTTLMILYVGASLSLLLKIRFGVLILFLVLTNIFLVNFGKLQERWSNTSGIGLYDKDYLVKEIVKRQPEGSEFYVSYIKYLGWNFGFDYLFKYYGRIPQTIVAKPPVYTIVLPKTLSPDSIDLYSRGGGLILPDEK